MYTRKYEARTTSGFGEETVIVHLETKREVSLHGEESRAWAYQMVRILPPGPRRQSFSRACRIDEPWWQEHEPIDDEEIISQKSDQIAEWFFVLQSRIISLWTMMVTKDPISLEKNHD